MAQSEVSTIYEDSRGFIWFGTTGGGLCKYDGKDFSRYTEKDGLAGPIITSIMQGAYGNLWIGSTWGGLTRYNGKKFKKLTTKDGLLSNAINCIAVDSAKNLWVGSHGGVNVTSSDMEFINYTEATGLLSNVVNCLFTDNKGAVWIGTTKGINVYDNNLLTKIDMEDGLPYSNISAIRQDSKGNMWIGTNGNGILLLSAVSLDNGDLDFEQVGPEKGLRNARIHFINEDSRGTIWIGTESMGVIKISDGKIVPIRYQNGIGSDKILSLCEDKHGNLWFGTGGAGAMRYSGGIFTYFKDVDGFGNGNIFSIAESNDQSIWVGTATDGVYVYKPSDEELGIKPKNLTSLQGLAGNNVRAMVSDGKNMWLGTDKGLSKYDGKNFINFNAQNGFRGNEIRSLLKDSKGNLWVGTFGQGVAKYDGNTFTYYNENDGMSHGYVHSILEDSKGNLWLGTGNGVNKFDGQEFTTYGTRDGFCNSYIGSMAEDLAGNIWFGTDRCVVRYDGKRFTQITEKDGLMSNTIYLLQLDDQGNLWVGSNKGVDKLVLDATGKIEEIISYGKEQGFRGVECNTRAVCLDNQNNLWFGTIGGAIKYNPNEDLLDTIPPSVHITNIKLFFEDVDLRPFGKSSQSWFKLPNSLELPYDKNHVTFQFLGISSGNASSIGYSFKLEGFDLNWLPVTNKREATYSNIPPGTYTFLVKAVNSDGYWNEEPAKYTLTIDVPYWRSWWFYLGMALLTSIFIFLFTKHRTKKLNKAKLILEEEVQRRLKEITKEKEEKELLIKEVHHRVKNNLQIINSLLSIQSSYIEDEKIIEMFSKSIDRIKSMAIIHEKLYKSTDLTHIDIEDYLHLLAHGLINSYNLDKHIKTDIEILVKQLSIDTLIPIGLIINELLTNSIKHAFEGKTVGKISIFMDVTDDRKYKLIVGDDGKGFKKKKADDEDTLGMELIKILVDQIDGTIERRKQKGTVYKILFRGIGKDKIIN